MTTNDLTPATTEGYEAQSSAASAGSSLHNSDRPYLASSPNDIAWRLGVWLAKTGRGAPSNVRMSRGYSIRANNMLLKWNGGTEFERIN